MADNLCAYILEEVNYLLLENYWICFGWKEYNVENMPIVNEGCNDTLQNPCRLPPQPNVVTVKKEAARFPQHQIKVIVLYMKRNQITTISKQSS
jgi:hypothetical protein